MKTSAIVSAVLVLASAALAPCQDYRFYDEIEVRRVELTVRVLDPQGEPMTDLGPDDLLLVVDGREVRPESVEWIDGAEPGALVDASRSAAAEPGREVEAGSGRLIVLLYQIDFDVSRVTGLMRMAHRAPDLVATLTPGDRVAVLTYDSHLSLQLDFSADRERLLETLRVLELVQEVDDPSTPDTPSLLHSLDLDAASTAYSPETALLVLGQALEQIPGPKTLILFGWGIGRLTRMGIVKMHDDYPAAREALSRAGVTVFSLDITDADAHSLEAGLQTVAYDTGGYYRRTHLFPELVMLRLSEALAGHYLVVFDSPAEERGEHRLRVRLRDRRGTVLAPRTFFD